MRGLLPLLAVLAFAIGVSLVDRNPSPLGAALPVTAPQTALEPPTPGRRKGQGHHEPSAPKEHQESQDAERTAKAGPAPTVRQDTPPHHDGVGPKAEGDGQWYARPDWWVAGFTGLLFLVTAALWWVTLGMWRTTAKAVADGESAIGAALSHVAESARAATAMEGVATAMSANVIIVQDVARTNKGIADQQATLLPLQMRAYISVKIGPAVYQDSVAGVRFAANPLLINTGNTPAYNVRYRIKADVLPIPLTESIDFSLPAPSGKGNLVAPHGNGTMSAVVDQIFPAEEVADIKQGKGRALAVWGRIEYEDVFREPHYTNFCQVLTWGEDNSVTGYHQAIYSDAN